MEIISAGNDLKLGRTADPVTKEVLRQDLKNCCDLLELEPSELLYNQFTDFDYTRM